MGAVFSLPWTRLAEWYDALPRLSEAGFVTMALTPAPDAIALDDAVTMFGDRPICVVLGSEGPGLTPRWLHAADVHVAIPMAAGVDSLNVAAAAAVAFYALRSPS